MYKELKEKRKRNLNQTNDLDSDRKKIYRINLDKSRILFLISLLVMALSSFFLLGYFVSSPSKYLDSKAKDSLAVGINKNDDKASFKEIFLEDSQDDASQDDFKNEKEKIFLNQTVPIKDASKTDMPKQSIVELDKKETAIQSVEKKSTEKVLQEPVKKIKKIKKKESPPLKAKPKKVSVKKIEKKKQISSDSKKDIPKKPPKNNKIKKDIPKEKLEYRIQVSIHKNRDYAVLLKEKLVNKGYNAYILEKTKNKDIHYYVQVGPFLKKDFADQTIKHLHNDFNTLKGAYIF